MKSWLKGLFQAMGVMGYCSLVGVIFWQGNELFGQPGRYLGPVVVLILLVASVLICGLIVFYKPYKLFFAGKKNEAIGVVASTAIWLAVFLIIVFVIFYLTK